VASLADQGLFVSSEDGKITLSFHIADEIKSPDHYTKFLELTRCLSEEDLLEIVISGSPGGLLSGARIITTAMDTCKARTEVVVIDSIASAATMIAVNADEVIMTIGSSMMIHNASYGTGGKASDIAAHVAFSTKDIKDTMEHFYRPFMTKGELKKLLRGEEYYLDAHQCMERFAKVKAKRQAEAEKYQKDMWEEQREVMVAQLAAIDEALSND